VLDVLAGNVTGLDRVEVITEVRSARWNTTNISVAWRCCLTCPPSMDIRPSSARPSASRPAGTLGTAGREGEGSNPPVDPLRSGDDTHEGLGVLRNDRGSSRVTARQRGGDARRVVTATHRLAALRRDGS